MPPLILYLILTCGIGLTCVVGWIAFRWLLRKPSKQKGARTPAATAAKTAQALGGASAMAQGQDRTTRPCPFCGEQILSVAIKCKHCQSMLKEALPSAQVNVAATASAADSVGDASSRTEGDVAGLQDITGNAGLASHPPQVESVEPNDGAIIRLKNWMTRGRLAVVLSCLGVALIIVLFLMRPVSADAMRSRSVDYEMDFMRDGRRFEDAPLDIGWLHQLVGNTITVRGSFLSEMPRFYGGLLDLRLQNAVDDSLIVHCSLLESEAQGLGRARPGERIDVKGRVERITPGASYALVQLEDCIVNR